MYTKKQVRFSNIVTVYEIDNSEEHRLARNGLQNLRDRQRFQRRIKNTELILNNVLKIKMTIFCFHYLPFNICTL